MEGGDSSDSGSGGIIDVSNMSSSFNAPSLHAGGPTCASDEKRNTGPLRHACPPSVEKVWFTDTTTGVWLFDEEQAECDIPDEYLDVSLESEEELNHSNSDDEEDRSKVDSENAEGTEAATPTVEQAQLCGWVPTQLCLIPLPDSPADSDHEREEEQERGGEGNGFDAHPSESELQRQHEKELEVLFGFKPPSTSDPAATGAMQVEEEKEGWDVGSERCGVFVSGEEKERVLPSARGNKRSNSTDSGVASISPHSTEDDMEHGHSRNGTETATTMEDITEQVTNVRVCESAGEDGHNRDLSQKHEKEGGILTQPRPVLTPERPPEQTHPPVSRLKTPSEKLRKCSVFTSSPVVCSELEELKEASKMAPLVRPPSSPPYSYHNTPDIQNRTHTISAPTSSSSSHSGGERSSDNVPVASSVVSADGSGGSRETKEQAPTVKNGKKNTNKTVSRGTFAYKPGTTVPQVKGFKKPPSKLRSLLPVSGIPSALPSQIRKPEMKHRGSDNNNPLPPSAVGEGQLRKTSTTGAGRSSKLVPPGQRKMSDNGSRNVQKSLQSTTFVRPALVMKPAGSVSSSNPAPGTPARSRTTATSKLINPSHSTTPSRVTGHSKQPPKDAQLKRRATTASVASPAADKARKRVLESSTNTNSILSMSIVSTSSSSTQQSTPMKQAASCSSAVQRTVTKAVNTTVTKDSSAPAPAQQDEDSTTVPLTPRSLVVGSTPSRRIRPKFSLSSIDSDSDSTRQPSAAAAAGNTFTVDTGQAVPDTPRNRKSRRSFIPTPIRPEHREVIPLVYSSDCKSTQQQGSPVSRRAADNGAGVRGEEKKASMAHPRQRRPLVSRNRLAAGLGKKLPQKGPLKPMNTYKYLHNLSNLGENAEPPVSNAKMAHSPVNKEDKGESPHSAWSPIRRKPVVQGEECFRCTKRGHRN